jgi:polyphosphate glucokinase
MNLGFGVDIGGSGIKGAPVDLGLGQMTADRIRFETPQPSTPAAVADAVAALVDGFSWTGAVGCTFPAVVRQGTIVTAANVDPGWIGVDAASVLSDRVGSAVHVVNDADAAGVAEVRFGAGKGVHGSVLVVTLGTGIGTALFVDGVLVPNLELGHIELDGVVAETRAASRWRKEHDLSWDEWGDRVGRYLTAVERLVWPNLIIVGGGVSKRHERFFHRFNCKTPVVPAALLNDAGIVGAALLAAD